MRSPTVGDFYGTAIENWVGFGLIGSTEKRVWTDYEQLLRLIFFMFSGAKKHCSVQTKKLHKKSFKRQAKKHFQLCLAPIETPHRGTYL